MKPLTISPNVLKGIQTATSQKSNKYKSLFNILNPWVRKGLTANLHSQIRPLRGARDCSGEPTGFA
jgi:hypothetical protein